MAGRRARAPNAMTAGHSVLLSLLRKVGPLADSPSHVPLQPLHSVHHPLAPMLQGPQGNVHGYLGGGRWALCPAP